MTLESGSIKPDDTLTVNYNVLDPSMITADDIIGGISDTGDYSGIQLAQKAYPQFNEVLGSLIAPSWSQDIKVSVALLSIAKKLNSVFIANAIVDLDTSSCKKYQDAIDVKQKSSLIDAHYNLCFGDAYLADTKYNLSTLVAAVKQYITQQNDNFPNQNPSNKLLYINNFKLNGKELYLDREQANYLNANGIITARNGTSGWRVWGNRTACFPSDTDIKNFDIAVRDCFNFVRNTCVVSVDQMVDSQIDRALILRIESTLQGWVDGLVGSGKLISGKINFLKDRNPLSELLAGNIYFNLQITSGPTASSISIDVAFNVNDLNRIFEG
jgi:phage tail sheath protein FI